MESYKVIFQGRIGEGKDTIKIGVLLAQFLKLPESKAEQLFNGKAYALKKNLNHEKAKQVQSKLSSIGIITEIIKEISISEDVSFQEGLKTDSTSADFETSVDGKKCCKHCGSNLEQEIKSKNDSLNSERDKLSNIEANEVSEKWNEKFALIRKIGGEKKFIYEAKSTPEYKSLNFKDKYKISFNILAALFGPLYYFFKKMWLKGFVILAGIWILSACLTLIESLIGTTLPPSLYWIPGAILCGQLANYDYYRLINHNETTWNNVPSFLKSTIGTTAFTVGALVLLFGSITLTPEYQKEIDQQTLVDVSGVWRGNSDGAMITIKVTGKDKVLDINGRVIPVTIDSIDTENSIISLGVRQANGASLSWSLRQLFDENGSFTLEMTLHDGTQDELSYIRGI